MMVPLKDLEFVQMGGEPERMIKPSSLLAAA